MFMEYCHAAVLSCYHVGVLCSVSCVRVILLYFVLFHVANHLTGVTLGIITFHKCRFSPGATFLIMRGGAK